MAFWITHLRIADILSERLVPDPEAFICGSLAPDSGKLNSDMLTYTPSRHVLHHTSDDGKTIYYSRFADEYIFSDERCVDDYRRLSFLYGYYTHLYTDHVWATSVYLPLVEANRDRMKNEPGFRRYMKSTVESCDKAYLHAHSVQSLDRLRAFGYFDCDYLDYISSLQLNEKLDEIRNCYSDISLLPEADESYYTCERLDGFINKTASDLLSDGVAEKAGIKRRQPDMTK